jgi:hypothetical protein
VEDQVLAGLSQDERHTLHELLLRAADAPSGETARAIA